MIQILCAECYSSNILMDAYAKWDVQKQDWVLNSLHEQCYCENCEGECKIKEVNING